MGLLALLDSFGAVLRAIDSTYCQQAETDSAYELAGCDGGRHFVLWWWSWWRQCLVRGSDADGSEILLVWWYGYSFNNDSSDVLARCLFQCCRLSPQSPASASTLTHTQLCRGSGTTSQGLLWCSIYKNTRTLFYQKEHI